MHIRAIQTPTAHTDLQPKRRTWPPPALKEASDVKRATPRRWRLVRDRLFAHLGCCMLIIAMLVGASPSFAHGDDEITTGTLTLEAPQGRLESPRIRTDVAMQLHQAICGDTPDVQHGAARGRGQDNILANYALASGCDHAVSMCWRRHR